MKCKCGNEMSMFIQGNWNYNAGGDLDTWYICEKCKIVIYAVLEDKKVRLVEENFKGNGD